MNLFPAKTKFRKQFKGRMYGNATSGHTISFGAFALKSLGRIRISSKQIESARKAVVGATDRKGTLWIRVFPDVPVSIKPAEVRMGGGKGGIEYYVARVYPGTILFEIDGVSEEIARLAFERAAAKLPMKTKFVKRVGSGDDDE